MRERIPLVLFFLAVLISLLTIFGDESYARLRSLQDSLSQQQKMNLELGSKVQDMRHYAAQVQNDARTLEKVARSELGMARKGEILVFFEPKHEEKNKN